MWDTSVGASARLRLARDGDLRHTVDLGNPPAWEAQDQEWQASWRLAC